jgi:hypothetical protein
MLLKVSEDDVYMNIDNITLPEDALPVEMIPILQVIQGDRLQIPLENSESINIIEQSDMQEAFSAKSDITLLEEMLTTDGVREYDPTRKSTDYYVPIRATDSYQANIDDDVDYGFLQYGGERLLH